MDAARKRLFAVLQERSRVLDLLNQSLSSISNVNSAMSNATTASGLRRSKSVQDGRFSRMNCSNLPDPLGPFTPEADQALADAEDARARSAYLRRELREAIDRIDKLQKAAHKSVNDGLTQKLSETVTLKVHLGYQNVILRKKLLYRKRSYMNCIGADSSLFKFREKKPSSGI